MPQDYYGNGPKGTRITQQFKPLERLGITLGNKISSSFNINQNRKYIPSRFQLDCADHICVDRYYPTSYTHHGLYLGFGLVIHYDFKEICVVTLEEFSKGKPIYRVNSPLAYAPAMAMARATKRLGEREYHLITNNCEHFVRWCRNGMEL